MKSIHFILTYACNFECDHCFLYCHPYAEGTFTIQKMKEALDEFAKMETIRSIGFEGGETFLYYPLLLESIRLASERGFTTAVQTNCYWATSKEDALLWLKPLKSAGLATLEASDDTFHHGNNEETPAKAALSAAEQLGISVNSICIQPPRIENGEGHQKGVPIYLGGPKLRGRAVEKLVKNLPTTPYQTFTECPFEDLESPDRVHVDPFGNVHLCQGLTMGNMWKTPFSALSASYKPFSHPICGPILEGGPAQLAKKYNLTVKPEYVDACHLCSELCLSLIDRFPQHLTPRQVYGLE